MSDSTITRIIGLILVATLAGCGGSSGSDTVSQPPPPPSAIAKTTVGQITGFGSIYVNGVEYDTAGAAYVVDDASASSDSALAVGMVVNVQGSVNPDGKTGSAESVSYDDDIEGIVEDLATDPDDMNVKTFVVMGVPIQADKNRTNFEGEDDPAFSFDTIMNGDNVEVSGEYSDVLLASYIEKQDADDDEFEAKGTVDEYNGSDEFVLVLRNGSTLNVTIAAGAEIPDAGVMDGQYVEVEGTIPDPVAEPDAFVASKVEVEDEDRIDGDDEDEVEIKGILTYNADTVSWSVKDVQLAFGDNTEYSPETLEDGIADLSADGLYVEVEGQYVDEVLQVREIEIEEDELEFKADIDDVTVTEPRDGSLVLSFGNAPGTVDVRVTPDTMFLDDDAMEHYDLNSIMVDDKVEVKARMGDGGIIYASSLHLEDDMGYEIEGPMDAMDEVSIEVLGVVFTIDMDTFFENGMPTTGDFVEVEDDDADGIADSVEVED